MANEYLLSKWKLWFRILDRKHAGKISKEDEKREEEAYVKLAHLEGERKAEAIETLQSLWNEIIFHGQPGPLTEQEFVDLTHNDYRSDKEKFTKKIRRACIADLNIRDQRGEGLLTEEEFINVNKSMGFDDEKWNKMFFQAFNPIDGKIRTDAICDAWVQFSVNEDSSKKDIFQEAYETYPSL